jgi:hypothetical protein
MPGPKFRLLPQPNTEGSKLQYIWHPASGLKINVYPLFNYPFCPNPKELCFYGRLFQWWHAFETEGFQEQQLLLIGEALQWYAEISFYPQMEPQAFDPRPLHQSHFLVN